MADVEPSVVPGSFEGVDSLVLSAGSYELVVLPELGMLGASLQHDGLECVSLHGGVDHYRQHHTTGIPLLHPWANRLGAFEYEADGMDVRFDPLPPVTLAAGLPIHGTMHAAHGWEVEQAAATTDVAGGASGAAVVVARYRFGLHPDQLRSFPFPHEIVLRFEVTADGVMVATTIVASGLVAVPVSFGWHPYFTLPRVRRYDLALVLPERDHLELDATMLPTGAFEHEPGAIFFLGDGDGAMGFDDAYRLSDDVAERVLAIEGPSGPRLSVSFDAGYPYAQVYAPPDESFVALEPMTAPINALISGEHPSVEAGGSFTAAFTVRVTP